MNSCRQINEKDNQLFQIMQNAKNATGIETIEHTPGLLAKTLMKELPEVEYATAVIPVSWFDKKGILSDGNKLIPASGQFAGKIISIFFHTI